MTTNKKVLPILLSVAIAAGAGLAMAQAQTPAPAPAPTSGPEQNAPAATAKQMLGLGAIEAILQKEGIKVHELEVRDAVVEAEGRDASQRKVELVVDRRSGEILSRRFDD
jgi:hypothetical protein